MKRTKKFNQEWADAIALLPQNLQQSLTDAIRSYQNEGIEPEGLHPIAQALFIVIKPTIDARARRCAYQKARRNRSSISSCKSVEIPIPSPTPVAVSASVASVTIPSEMKPIISDGTPPAATIPVQEKRPLSGNRFLRQVERERNRSRLRR